jgi:hypothetical protein
MERLKFTLRENAIDFLEDALSNAVVAEEAPRRWKFAVISVVQSIELSLKQLLSQVHPLFVYANVDNRDKTVTLDQAVERLKRVANLKLTKEEAQALKLAKEARHRIVHHEVDENIRELKLAFAKLLAFQSAFYDTHFDKPLHDEIDEQLWRTGLKIREYGQELLKKAVEKIEANINREFEEVMVCPSCGWEAMLLDEDNTGQCFMCGHQEQLYCCDRCNCMMVEGEQEDKYGKVYCHPCLEYVSSDYWYEQSAGK